MDLHADHKLMCGPCVLRTMVVYRLEGLDEQAEHVSDQDRLASPPLNVRMLTPLA